MQPQTSIKFTRTLIEEWVQKDEILWTWFTLSKMTMPEFVSMNLSEIKEIITALRDKGYYQQELFL